MKDTNKYCRQITWNPAEMGHLYEKDEYVVTSKTELYELLIPARQEAAKKIGSYYKTDIKFTWIDEEGETYNYSMRFDMNAECLDPFNEFMSSHLFSTGVRPYWMDEEKYEVTRNEFWRKELNEWHETFKEKEFIAEFPYER